MRALTSGGFIQHQPVQTGLADSLHKLNKVHRLADVGVDARDNCQSDPELIAFKQIGARFPHELADRYSKQVP